jgi:hypothetical protein
MMMLAMPGYVQHTEPIVQLLQFWASGTMTPWQLPCTQMWVESHAGLQEHLPEMHASVVAHTVPHAPQWLRSVRVSTQPTAPHIVLFAAQAQVPCAQIMVGSHATLQPPQWPVSVCSSTQLPPQ